MAPQGGHARYGAPPPPQVGAPAPVPAAPPAPRGNHDGDRHDGGDRHFDRGGDHNSFAPGGTAPGDRRWDRHEAPREVTPPVNAEHGWDRDHDGHAADGHRLSRDGRDDAGRWDRDHNGDHNGDHRGPPANWRHWQRGQLPPVYSASHRYHVGSYRPPYGWYVRNWGFGDVLPHGWYGSSFWIDDFYDYDLPYPPPGMHWVRVGDDVFLVDDYSGRIVQVIRDMFW
jgi:Ni/Co efflux regulator RcnB